MEKNGFIADSGKTGLITYLTLGKRVVNKLSDVIRQEMNHIDAQELEMPTISDLNLWDLTGRNELLGHELFRLKDRKNNDLCLCPTHEEIVTSLVAKMGKTLSKSCLSPGNALKLYQITRKYRDESRPKHGLLRTREFLMKDLYTFHFNEECANTTYDQVCKSYETVFERLDLNYIKASASVGAMGGKRSDEYHIISQSVGEDKIFTCEECKKSISFDLIEGGADELPSQAKICQAMKCGRNLGDKKINYQRCIEIGHTFILGDRYTKYFPIEVGASQSGSKVTMGCYGIGVSRLLQACVEQNHVEKRFPNWPLEIAPFKIAIVPAKIGSKEEEKSNQLVDYQANLVQSIFPDDVLVDDRTTMSIGSRLIDLKLIGVPYVIVLGKHIHDEHVEIVIASTKMRELLKKDSVICHTRETAAVLKQINNDYFYAKKQQKFSKLFSQ